MTSEYGLYDPAKPLRHYTGAPLGFRWGAEPEPITIGFKPKGLWVTVPGEYDWPSFCRNEGFRLDLLKHEHDVQLAPDARVLHLSTPDDLRRFTDDYACDKEGPRMYISWDYVMDEYQGIVISPYQWSMRLDSDVFWYYGWDCSSGCIWDFSAIQEITEIATP